ncbi:GNAT family N-acetyltransferase [Psychroserpens sp. SPM9]|uniref:GNAT family N-acetyltransferase n=1 Tax=Psychroserpens sp. SPM9 TaxID=2975598 RepID=UPI0021A8E9CA|nr:GNAT family N-acetyltransferase [Psychroserpens sp. SPM9]MDG5491290.1 GNAT family N-acetyltransferase [Psychroserpens sp. SPM9]
MKENIDYIDKFEYPQVITVWEASVRATHHFLKEEDIAYFKPLILNTYLDAVELRCYRGENHKILGFMGVSDGNLEMLFIHPEHRGQRIGQTLLDYAINHFKVTKVDVNEQNVAALGFYKHCGFVIKGRSETDASGKPYPILHMELISSVENDKH